MGCPGREDWIVPRRLMCFLFWTGTVLLFAGILLVVTSKHRGQVFLSWGGVLLGVGSCVLIACLVLCIHAYYVIAETRTNAEHTLINNLQLQRKANSVPSCSSDIDGVWRIKGEPYTVLGGQDGPANGGYSELRHPSVQSDAKIRIGYRTFPSERELGDEDEEGWAEKGDRQTTNLSRFEPKETATVYTVSSATPNHAIFSETPNGDASYPLVPPPSYFQLNPALHNSTAAAASNFVDAASHVFAVRHLANETKTELASQESPEGERSSGEHSVTTKTGSSSSNLKSIVSVSGRKAQGQLPSQQSGDFTNTSSQSSAPNSSTEFENEATDTEVSRAMTSERPIRSRDMRLRNNTPVDLSSDPSNRVDSLLARRPPRLNIEPMTHDTDVHGGHQGDRADRVTMETAVSRQVTSPHATGVKVVNARTDAPHLTPGSRRHITSESITRPFGHGTVTVTPLYRPPPKTPPTGGHRSATLGSEGQRVKTGATTPSETIARGVTVVAGGRGGRAVPMVSVTPCIPDKETDIGVCQSDVTVYDNVMDTVRV